MKKRLIGTLLMGALMVSSTSVFVSCKDYDDDINNIVATKADKTALDEARKTLESEIQGLRDQLSTAQGQIDALTNSKADKFKVGEETYNLETVWNQLYPLLQRVSNCESDIDAHQKAIDNINSMIGGKLEGDLAGKTYKEALTETYATAAAASTQAAKNLEAITDLQKIVNDPETGLVAGLKAVKNDLQSQVEALEKLATRVQTIEGDYLKAADKKALQDEIDAKINKLNEDLTNAIKDAKQAAIEKAAEDATTKADKALGDAKKYTYDQIAALNIDSLKAAVKNLSDSVDKYVPLVNNLNVYVRQSLRGLVFNMGSDLSSYYQGVEATDLTVLTYRKYDKEMLGTATADTKETYGYSARTPFSTMEAATADNVEERLNAHKWVSADDKTTRVKYTEATRVLAFTAEYFMNPSSAKIDEGAVSVIDFNKPFHSSVTGTDTLVWDAEFNGNTGNLGKAGISVIDWKTEGGKLIVNYDCTDPDKIQSIVANKAITIFATQVAVAKDTTVTSDFAALYRKDVRNIRISHTPEIANGFSTHNGAMIHKSQRFGSHKDTLVNKHCGYCAYQRNANDNEYHSGLHLMQTVAEAAGIAATNKTVEGGFYAQDSVGYQDTLDLMKLVEIHCDVVDENGNKEHGLMSAANIAAAGLHFEFELTGLYYGSNGTSESAHAAIKKIKFGNDSIIALRPQMPDSVIIDGKKEGIATDWDNEKKTAKAPAAGKQLEQTIGRTPLVRVKLLDKQNNVVDYGYIRIKIIKHPVEPTPEGRTSVTYNVPGMTASVTFCDGLNNTGFEFTQRWIQMEYDIHHLLGIDQNQFTANYEPDYVAGTNNQEFKQFYLDNGTPKAVTNTGATMKLGQVLYLENDEDWETSVVMWTVGDNDLNAYYNALPGTTNAEKQNAANVVRSVRFKKKANSTLDGPTFIYIDLIPASFTINDKPTVYGVVNWNNEWNKKNASNWYIANGNPGADGKIPAGLDETHAQTLSPEDELSSSFGEWTGHADSLTTHLSDVFTKATNSAALPNKIITNSADAHDKFITLTGLTGKSGKDLELDLVFVDTTYASGKEYVGNNGKTYVISVGDKAKYGAYREKVRKGKALIATEKGTTTKDTIAVLRWDGSPACAAADSINHWVVSYRNNEIADALLNYKAHNELGNDVLKAVVGVKATYNTCNVPLQNNTLDVRFLRPINVFGNDFELGDASNNGLQQIFLRDVVRFTDWRDVAFTSTYWDYYQIKTIEIDGVRQGENISKNINVKTDLDNETTPVSLQTKNNQLDFVYTSKPAGPICAYGNKEDYGVLTYSNFSNITREFHIWLPIKVTYLWGAIYTDIRVTIKATQGNQGARQTK